MKKCIAIVLLVCLLLAGCGRKPPASGQEPLRETPAPSAPAATTVPTPEPTPTPTPRPTKKPISPEVLELMPRNLEVYEEKLTRHYMAGRLLIPSVGIDVALFLWGEGEDEDVMRQNVTDNLDSAMLYSDGVGQIIADHSNQEFRSLPLVRVTDSAYILAGDFILSLTCDMAISGINTGFGITDKEGYPVTADEDFVCYTCGDNWTDIRIVGLQETDKDVFFLKPAPGGGFRYADEFED